MELSIKLTSIKLTDLEKEQIVEAAIENYIESNGYYELNSATEDNLIDALDEGMLNIIGYVSYNLDAETRKYFITEILNKINNFCKQVLENNARLMQQLLA